MFYYTPSWNTNIQYGKIILFFLCILLIPLQIQAQFSRVAGDGGLGLNTAQDGGQAWGDLNKDGYPDVIVHADNQSGNNTPAKLYINNGPPNFDFTDRTDSLIDGFNDGIAFGRQMLIVDFNNDGYNDVLRGGGGSNLIEVYYNQGPPAYEFGDVNEQPQVTINSMPDGQEFNIEGVGAIDWNQDGWLDMIIDNDAGGNDIYENDQAGGFTYISPGTAVGQTGFPASHSGDGDYLTVADLDNDGYVDFYGRKTAVSNYWRFNSITQQFVTQSTPNITSSEGDKGGTMFCDFDNDGDLDLFWTSHGVNQIWRFDGVDMSGDDIWTATGLPGGSIGSQTNIDGCDCGDVDNDGDLDIILGASSGNSYLLTNQLKESGSLTFNTVNVATNANTEGTIFTDYDNDGDLDLYFVVHNAANQLWVNSTSTSASPDTNFLYVNALVDNGNSTNRDAIGANIILTDCNGFYSGMRQVNGAMGHGTQHQKKIHFGVDPDETYIVLVYYIFKNGTRKVVKRTVTPSLEPNNEITIIDTDASNTTGCLDLDMDGTTDEEDLDDDNDGIPDVIEVCGMGASDYSCLDTILYDGSNNGLDPSGDEDSDGIPNYLDANDPIVNHYACTDANSDGICDGVPIFLDTDKDSIPNYRDLDADNDGIPDLIEVGGTDTDGDGIEDSLKDSDNDGIPDSVDADNVSCSGDTSPADGICDDAQGGTDTDNDGIQDTDDPDSDGDGLADNLDNDPNDPSASASTSKLLDTNGDGTNNADIDTDNDSRANFLDLDADNDGIPDIAEVGGTDTDGNGLVDVTTDSNKNGYSDTYDPTQSGTAHFSTGADSGNGQPTSPCSDCDSDSDGLPDYIDLDADNDGIPDIIEANGIDTLGNGYADNLTDSDGDGLVNLYDPAHDGPDSGLNADPGSGTPLMQTGANSGDGTPVTPCSDCDTDSDGLADYVDLDADNDGIPDLVEVGGIDTLGNGRVDTPTDSDGDGYADIYEPDFANDPLVYTNNSGDLLHGLDDSDVDWDNDLIPDHLDLDSDNDGIPDLIEAGGPSANADGMVDTGVLPWDADNDGLSDLYDTNASDGPGSAGLNGTALVETTMDNDGDGRVGVVGENMITGGSNISIDIDNDKHPNHLDLDADNDGLTDVVENGGGVVSVDGTANNLDGIVGNAATVLDTDDDGWNDPSTTATLDSDGDGIKDFLDIDADNDGIPDYLEAVCTGCVGATGGLPTGADANGNGVLDLYEGLDDTNATASGTNIGTTPNEDDDDGGVPPDYLDTDTDEDGSWDWLEGYDSDGDGNAHNDIILMANAYETANGTPGHYPTGGGSDADSDGLPDWLDNQPSTSGYDENQRPPFLNSSNLTYWRDSNNNGLVDLFDVAINGTEAPTPDSDAGNDADWRDFLYAVVLPVDLLAFEGKVEGCRVNLFWISESEDGFSHYELERSADGFLFKQIAKVNATGGNFSQSYHFLDSEAVKVNYYRLKMVDVDGTFTYSEPISLNTNCNDAKGKLEVFPNPLGNVSNVLSLRIHSDSQEMKLIITDMLGRAVRGLSLEVEEGWNQLRIDVADLPEGSYFIQQTNSQLKIAPAKFIIQGR